MSESDMAFEDLEQVYELLAEAVDAVDKNQTTKMLTKLALLLSHQIGDLKAVQKAILAAQEDL